MYNPTLNRTKRTVLAAPTAADGPATFRALDKNDVGLGNVDNVAALPLTGGTMSGAFNFANNTWNPVGDDVQIGDHNTSGSFYIQGLNGPTNIKLKKNGDTSEGSGDSATITYNGGNLIIDKTIQANLQGTAAFANGTLFNKAQWVSLTSLDQNTWYPVVSMNGIPDSGLHHIKCNVQLNSGSKPAWSTHSSGFTVNLDMLVMAYGWGTTRGQSILLDNSYGQTSSNANPAGYSQMGNSSKAVFWLRGGGSYRIYSDWDADWTVKTSTYTNNEQSVSPTTSYPGVNYNKATLDGGALSSYPVGSIYMSTSSTSPASIFGGSWQSIASERVLMGVSSSHGAGSTVDAGLPNISSGSDAALDIQGSWGAPACRAPFAQTWQGNSELSTSTWSSTPKIISARFDASLCNSIYGRSSTVQPAAYYVYMWRRTG